MVHFPVSDKIFSRFVVDPWLTLFGLNGQMVPAEEGRHLGLGRNPVVVSPEDFVEDLKAE